MTGAGTNTYLLRDANAEGGWAVFDPGPVSEPHLARILALSEGNVHSVVVTHTHSDHSPLATVLAVNTGAALFGRLSSLTQLQDTTFVPSHPITHDELLQFGENCVRAIHTPGHVDNHFCFLLEGEGILLAGDHIMNGSTVVIVPPQGDMKRYIESLELLQRYQFDAIAPGHGELIEQPRDVIDALIKHRKTRERKVYDAMQALGKGTLDDLVVRAYDDVDIRLHELAKYSLEAHLIKLRDESIVRANAQGVWSLI